MIHAFMPADFAKWAAQAQADPAKLGDHAYQTLSIFVQEDGISASKAVIVLAEDEPVIADVLTIILEEWRI